MTEKNGMLEQRVARLESQVAELTAALAGLRGAARAETVLPGEEKPRRPATTDAASEELLSWVDRAYVLPRIATTSFILVVALALRTLADGSVIEEWRPQVVREVVKPATAATTARKTTMRSR